MSEAAGELEGAAVLEAVDLAHADPEDAGVMVALEVAIQARSVVSEKGEPAGPVFVLAWETEAKAGCEAFVGSIRYGS